MPEAGRGIRIQAEGISRTDLSPMINWNVPGGTYVGGKGV